MKKIGYFFILMVSLLVLWYNMRMQEPIKQAKEYIANKNIEVDSNFDHVNLKKSNDHKSDEKINNELPEDEEKINISDNNLIQGKNVSLGGISTDFSGEEVFDSIGTTEGYRDPNDGMYFRYEYPDIHVTFVRAKVVFIKSKTDKVQTERGLKQGDSLQKVLSVYGSPDRVSDYYGKILYEYKFTSKESRESLLQFAIQDSQVAFIMIRIPDEIL